MSLRPLPITRQLIEAMRANPDAWVFGDYAAVVGERTDQTRLWIANGWSFLHIQGPLGEKIGLPTLDKLRLWRAIRACKLAKAEALLRRALEPAR